jgi:hypothetical protein
MDGIYIATGNWTAKFLVQNRDKKQPSWNKYSAHVRKIMKCGAPSSGNKYLSFLYLNGFSVKWTVITGAGALPFSLSMRTNCQPSHIHNNSASSGSISS